MEITNNPYAVFAGSNIRRKNNVGRFLTYLSIVLMNISLLNISYGRVFSNGKTNLVLIKHFFAAHFTTIIIVALVLGIINALALLDFATMNISWHKSPVAHFIIWSIYTVVAITIVLVYLISLVNIILLLITPKDWIEFLNKHLEEAYRDIKKDVLKGAGYLFVMSCSIGWAMSVGLVARLLGI